MVRTKSIDGSAVVITGASSGLGAATAAAFARHGCRLVLAARTESALEQVAATCRDAGSPQVVVVPTDVADPDDVRRLKVAAVDALDGVDIWIDAAAVLVAGPLEEQHDDELEQIVRTNVLGPVWCSRAALEVFRAQGHGTLINVASLLALIPNPLVPSYVATKFAVRGLSLSLRLAMSSYPDIHVCTVLPGPIDTPMFDHAANRTGSPIRAIAPAASVERVAAGIVSCARRPRRQLTVGAAQRLMLLGHRISPRGTELVAGKAAARLLVRPTEEPGRSVEMDEPAVTGAASGGWRLNALRSNLGDRVGRWLADR